MPRVLLAASTLIAASALAQAQTLYRVNAGGPEHVDIAGNVWENDAPYINTGQTYETTMPVAGTVEQALYQTERWDPGYKLPELRYSFPVAPGTYAVRLHFAEIFSLIMVPGERVFDVSIEGVPVLVDYDITAAVGTFRAVVEEFNVDVTDGVLEIDFAHVVENPKVSAIEIEALTGAALRALPAALDFGTTLVGESSVRTVTLTSIGASPVMVDALILGGEQPGHYQVDAPLLPVLLENGQSIAVDLTFAPLARGSASAALTVSSDASGGSLVVPLIGDGIVPPILEVSPVALDFGSVQVPDSSTLELLVTNRGDLPLTISAIHLVGDAQNQFSAVAALPLVLDLDASAVIEVTFNPHIAGFPSVALQFDSNDPSGGPLVPLSGTAIARPAPPHKGTNEKPSPAGSIVVAVQPPELAVASAVDFGIVTVDSSVDTFLTLTNTGDRPLQITALSITDSTQFTIDAVAPLSVPPHRTLSLPLSFSPVDLGPLTAKLHLTTNEADPEHLVALKGVSVEPEEFTIFLAAGSDPEAVYSGAMTTDSTYANGNDSDPLRNALAPSQLFADSEEDDLEGLLLDAAEYAFTTQEPREWYLWGRFYFPDEPRSDGANSFWVTVDGKKAQKFGNNNDQFQAWHWDGSGLLESGALAPLSLGMLAAGSHTLTVAKREVVPIPPRLDVLCLTTDPGLTPTDLTASQGLYPATLTASPTHFQWGHVPLPSAGEIKDLTLTNDGDLDARITHLTLRVVRGVGHDFWVGLGGNLYTGDHEDVTYTVDGLVPAHGSLVVPLEFLPTEEVNNVVELVLAGNFQALTMLLEGEGADATGDPFLHVVIDAPELVVDHDQDGVESIELLGSMSHTHEFGHVLAAFEWSEGGVPFATVADTTHSLAVGAHTIALRISDDNVPPRTLMASASVDVRAPQDVPGALALYYPASTAELPTLLDAPPANAEYGEIRALLEVIQQDDLVGSSPFAGSVLVRLLSQVDLPASDSYAFLASGGSDRRLFVNGQPTTGPVALSAGRHTVEARFVVDSLLDLPVRVTYAVGAGPQEPIGVAAITHDESALVPVINTAPTSGLDTGGNPVRIEGLGFFPGDEVVVHWGGTVFAGPQLSVRPTTIDLVAPPGLGLVTVTVETPNGVSNAFHYGYSPSGPVPVLFETETLTSISSPTQADWGPDGRLYVGSVNGTITVFEFDDDYGIVATQEIPTLEPLSNSNLLGLAFSPFDSPGPVRIYVAHGALFANGGACVGDCGVDFSSYSGQISVLEGPNFDTVLPLITGLPVSNHDHGINGLQFDNDGALYICVGGNTNAGVPHCNLGDLPESPYSGAVLRAPIHEPGFGGEIVYLETASAQVNNNQICGDLVDSANPWVSVFAAGLRNPWDLVFTTRGRLFATDNGPNFGFGPGSTSATTESGDPQDSDELLLAEEFGYYGHPNRNRGRTDPRQNVYHGSGVPSGGGFTQALTSFPSSTNGIVEYRASTFRSALRGELVAQQWNGATFRVRLAPGGRSVQSVTNLPSSLNSLDVTTGPGGVLLGPDYSSHSLVLMRPVDQGVAGLTVYDIYPWRAHMSGGQSFVIGGVGFGDLSDTSVFIGGAPVQLTSVSPTRIRGTIPTPAAATAELLDVEVIVAGQPSALPAAFRYVLDPGTEPPHDEWSPAPALPIALGEVSGGWLGQELVLVGEGSNATLAYDPASGLWSSSRAVRPFVGNHHSAEVVDGKLYLIGGLGGGSEGRVQIYDAAIDQWTPGADMPWGAGSVGTAVIGGKIYAAGGIVGSSTVTNCARYDPLQDSWTALAPMPVGRNHAAAGSDGRRMVVIGGRGPGSGDGNTVANGFADLQVYDPASDAWNWSGAPESTLAPLPQARGGMGKAVYYGGEYFVFGGETLTGAGANPAGVYNRVDVYDPQANTWRSGAPMPTARHGIFPTLHAGRIHVAGGGVQAAFSQSSVHEIYAP